MKALIDPVQNNLVVQVEQDENIFEIGQPLYWMTCPEYVVAARYQYIESVYVEIEIPLPTAEQNQQTAIALLQQTDWTSVADVGNSELSNPYLANQSEFIAWRSQVRAIAVNPISGDLDIFGQIPAEIWE